MSFQSTIQIKSLDLSFLQMAKVAVVSCLGTWKLPDGLREQTALGSLQHGLVADVVNLPGTSEKSYWQGMWIHKTTTSTTCVLLYVHVLWILFFWCLEYNIMSWCQKKYNVSWSNHIYAYLIGMSPILRWVALAVPPSLALCFSRILIDVLLKSVVCHVFVGKT